MNRHSLLYIVVAIFIAACSGGPKFDPHASTPCGSPLLQKLKTVEMTKKLNPELLKPSTDLFTIGPGDRLEIELIGDPNSRSSVIVGPDGKIYFDLLPGLKVWGLTIGQAKTLLEHEESKYIRGDPRIAITLREVGSKKVWLMGRLTAPGVYPLTSQTTLLEAISRAGGPYTSTTASPNADEFVSLHRTFVVRKGQLLPVDLYSLLHDGDMSQNIYLQSDDFVYLPPKNIGNVYVLGAVLLPRLVSVTTQTTLVSAIASAGGTIKYSEPRDVAIIRGSLTQPKMAVINYFDILHGKESDVWLEPGDIVYVPFSPFQTLARYADLVLQTFARTVGANAGVRAASGNDQTINASVSIPASGPQGLGAPQGLVTPTQP
jgi:polysaccharide export outer membrane protein